MFHLVLKELNISHVFIFFQRLMDRLRAVEKNEVDFSLEGKSSYMESARLKSLIIKKFRQLSAITGENYFGTRDVVFKYIG